MDATQITTGDLGAGQQAALANALNQFIDTLIQVAPRLGAHFASGGIMQVSTMSGATLKLGFAPQQGGIIMPGGITPSKVRPR